MAALRRDAARTLTLTAMTTGFAVVTLDVGVVNVAVKSIGAALGGGVSGLQWVVNAYTIAFAAFILTAGALADRIGARRVFVGGFVLFTLASIGCGTAPSLGVLIAARAVQGVGAALLVPASLSLLNHTYAEPGARARAVGMWHGIASVALAGAPLVGGALIAVAGWRLIFFINVPVALLGILLAVRYAAETPQSHDRGIDGAGQLTAVATLAALTAATIEGGVRGFGSAMVVSGFALAVALGAAFVAIEARGASPMLPLSLFRTPVVRACVSIGLLANVSFYGLLFVFSLFFQRNRGLSPLSTGLVLLPTAGGILVTTLGAGHVIGRIGALRSVRIGGALAAAGALGLLVALPSAPYPALVAPLAVFGLGSGLITPPLTYMLLGGVDRTRSGIAAGTLNTARQTGSAMGVALFGALLGGGFIAGMRSSLLIAAGVLLTIVLVAPLLDRDR